MKNKTWSSQVLCVVSKELTIVGIIRKSDEGEYLVIDLERIQVR